MKNTNYASSPMIGHLVELLRNKGGDIPQVAIGEEYFGGHLGVGDRLLEDSLLD